MLIENGFVIYPASIRSLRIPFGHKLATPPDRSHEPVIKSSVAFCIGEALRLGQYENDSCRYNCLVIRDRRSGG